MATNRKFNKRIAAPDFIIKRGIAIPQDGLSVKKLAIATFDPSADTLLRPTAAYGLGVYLPINAIITKVWLDVCTTFTSASTDDGTIAISIEGANDVVSAMAINDATSDIWDQGLHGTLVGTPILGVEASHDAALELIELEAAKLIKTSAEKEITVTVAVAALTAGKMKIFVEFIVSEVNV